MGGLELGEKAVESWNMKYKNYLLWYMELTAKISKESKPWECFLD